MSPSSTTGRPSAPNAVTYSSPVSQGSSEPWRDQGRPRGPVPSVPARLARGPSARAAGPDGRVDVVPTRLRRARRGAVRCDGDAGGGTTATRRGRSGADARHPVPGVGVPDQPVAPGEPATRTSRAPSRTVPDRPRFKTVTSAQPARANSWSDCGWRRVVRSRASPRRRAGAGERPLAMGQGRFEDAPGSDGPAADDVAVGRTRVPREA